MFCNGHLFITFQMFFGQWKICWAEARVKIAGMTLTTKLEGNWEVLYCAFQARIMKGEGVCQGLAKLTGISSILVRWATNSSTELVCMEIVQLEEKALNDLWQESPRPRV